MPAGDVARQRRGEELRWIGHVLGRRNQPITVRSEHGVPVARPEANDRLQLRPLQNTIRSVTGPALRSAGEGPCFGLEIVLSIVLLALLIAQNVRGMPRDVPLGLFSAGLVTIVFSIALGQARWQMAPAYLLFVVLSLLLLKRSFSHVAVRSIGVTIGALLLTIAVTLSLALPVVTLAAPNGSHVVGSRSSRSPTKREMTRTSARLASAGSSTFRFGIPERSTRRSPHLPSGRYGKSCIEARVIR